MYIVIYGIASMNSLPDPNWFKIFSLEEDAIKFAKEDTSLESICPPPEDGYISENGYYYRVYEIAEGAKYNLKLGKVHDKNGNELKLVYDFFELY